MMIAPLLDGLRELGYAEGRDVAIEDRLSDRGDQFPDLAAELVSVGVDVIVTRGISPAIAAKEATATIPIVAAALGDPIGGGVVTSLQRPEGNVTGLSTLSTGIVAKRLQLLKEIAPSTTRVGVLTTNPESRSAASRLAELDAAQPLNIRVHVLAVRTPDDHRCLRHSHRRACRCAAGAIRRIDAQLPVLVVELAAHHRLPAFYEHREFADIGGLVSYGPNLPALYRRAASYVDKIFKGARPADLPIEQPVTFDFIVNVATARTLGLTVPQPALIQATEIIE